MLFELVSDYKQGKNFIPLDMILTPGTMRHYAILCAAVQQAECRDIKASQAGQTDGVSDYSSKQLMSSNVTTVCAQHRQ